MSYDHAPNEQTNQTIERMPEQGPTLIFDPDNIPTITAQELSDFESKVYSSGTSPEQGQAMVDEWLRQKGVGLLDVQEGAFVANFVGVDGASDRRAMVAYYNDFGTRIDNANLVEEYAEAIPEVQAEEEKEQQRILESTLGNLKSRIATIETEMVDATDGRKTRNEIVDKAIDSIRTQVTGLVLGAPIDEVALRQLISKAIPDASEGLSDVENEGNSGRAKLVELIDGDFEYAYSRRSALEADRRKTLSATLDTSRDAAVQLRLNQTRIGNEARDAGDTVDEIAAVLNRMLNGPSDRQHYVSELIRLVRELDIHVGQTRTLAVDTSRLLEGIKKSLSVKA